MCGVALIMFLGLRNVGFTMVAIVTKTSRIKMMPLSGLRRNQSKNIFNRFLEDRGFVFVRDMAKTSRRNISVAGATLLCL